jgi:hypothetical protein
MLDHVAITNSPQWLESRRITVIEQIANLIQEAAGHHLFHSPLDPLIQFVTITRETEPEHRFGDRFVIPAGLRLECRRGTTRKSRHFKCPYDAEQIVRMDGSGSLRIQSMEPPVKSRDTPLCCFTTEFIPKRDLLSGCLEQAR